MFKKICRICGKEFLAKQSNYVCCSAECHDINQYNTQLRYHANLTVNQREERNKRANEWYRKHKAEKPPKLCLTCNQPLANRKQVRCTDCLLKEYMISRYKSTMAKSLANRGYDKEMIIDEIKRKGWMK